ncbi:hypothetical protein Cgig2_012001 [Carnegiea gigantea]|uniref:Uncharacterized protein n=1 Tax=Carnegiea gigantea TaxID=171969 RepID=A0A9Q1KNL5_9CARY|nr:hypothetical protein Cgig2_012001 [Carnegiea gigantea]
MVLKNLRPNNELSTLRIGGYKGMKLPTWTAMLPHINIHLNFLLLLQLQDTLDARDNSAADVGDNMTNGEVGPAIDSVSNADDGPAKFDLSQQNSAEIQADGNTGQQSPVEAVDDSHGPSVSPMVDDFPTLARRFLHYQNSERITDVIIMKI